jgi:hypothetical protein
VSRLKEKGISRRGWRSNEIATKIATSAENPDSKPYTPTPGTLVNGKMDLFPRAAGSAIRP